MATSKRCRSPSVCSLAAMAGKGMGRQAANATAPLDADEIADLEYMREEEKLARDVYQLFFSLYADQTFYNISRIFPFVAIGSYDESTGTWLAAWANRKLPPLSAARSAAIGGFLEAHYRKAPEDLPNDGPFSAGWIGR